MNGTEKVVKHLEMTQGVINRLGNNGSLVKRWSMTIIVAAMVLIAKHDVATPYFVLVLILPVLAFWILDGYFLWQERLFRKVYDQIRVQSDTNFEMNPMAHKNEPKGSLSSAILSVTQIIFYLVEVLFILFVFLIINFEKPEIQSMSSINPQQSAIQTLSEK